MEKLFDYFHRHTEAQIANHKRSFIVRKDQTISRDTLTMAKIVALTLPGIEAILRGYYELLFSCATIEEFLFIFTPLSFEIFRSKDVSYEDKFTNFRLTNALCQNMHSHSHSAVLSFDEFLAEFFALKTALAREQASESERQAFDTFLGLIETLDKTQKYPLETLIDPFFFPETEERRVEIHDQRTDTIRALVRGFQTAPPERLERVFALLEHFGVAGWDKEVVWDGLSQHQLDQLRVVALF